MTLLLIDPHHLVQQPKLITAFACNRAESHQVLGKARSAVANSGIEKSRADAAVGADSLADLLHVRPDRFTNRGDCVDEGNFHCQESIRSVLYEFSTFCTGNDQLRRDVCAVWGWNRVIALVVAAVGQRRVNLTQHRGAATAVSTHDDAVGIEKVSYCCALPQKFWIGGDIKRIRSGSIAQNNLANPVARIYGHRAFFNDDLVAINGSGDAASHRFHI